MWQDAQKRAPPAKKPQARARGAWVWRHENGATRVGGKDKQVREHAAAQQRRPTAPKLLKRADDTHAPLSSHMRNAICAELLPQPTTGELPVHGDGKAVPNVLGDDPVESEVVAEVVGEDALAQLVARELRA